MNHSIPVLGMEDVGKSFQTPQGRIEVLRHVNLAISEGEFVAVTGPSGSGKSTCLHLAALLDQPTTGRVLFDGQDLSVLAEPELCQIRKHKVGMVFQMYCLLPHRTVAENVLFRYRYLDHDRTEAEKQAMHALEAMDLTGIANRPARLLSGGEMQRVAIARAVALEPRLLIADEPTGNLDRVSAMGVMDCFKRLHQAGITILMVTHNEALLGFCSRHLRLELDGCIEN